MTHADTLIDHEPFAACFVQVGALTGLDQIGYESASYYPMNSELAHSLPMLPGRSDEIGIFVNLAWLALALLAAWVHRRQCGPWVVVTPRRVCCRGPLHAS